MRITATATAGEAVIRMLVAHCDTLFGDESRAALPRPEQCSAEATINVAPLRNTAHRVVLKAFLGHNARSDKFLVREAVLELPTLAMFALDEGTSAAQPLPKGCMRFSLAAAGAAQAAAGLIRRHFLADLPPDALPNPLCFTSLRTAGRLVLLINPAQQVLQVHSDELDTLADVAKIFSGTLPVQQAEESVRKGEEEGGGEIVAHTAFTYFAESALGASGITAAGTDQRSAARGCCGGRARTAGHGARPQSCQLAQPQEPQAAQCRPRSGRDRRRRDKLGSEASRRSTDHWRQACAPSRCQDRLEGPAVKGEVEGGGDQGPVECVNTFPLLGERLPLRQAETVGGDCRPELAR